MVVRQPAGHSPMVKGLEFRVGECLIAGSLPQEVLADCLTEVARVFRRT